MFDLSKAPTPPRAKKVPSSESHHGYTRHDDYGWLRVDNWMEVMADPSKLDAEVKAYLDAENDFTQAVLAPTVDLQETLFNEIKGRIKGRAKSWAKRSGGSRIVRLNAIDRVSLLAFTDVSWKAECLL